jgi:hypothetical protein
VLLRFANPLISPGGVGGGQHLTALQKLVGNRLGSGEQLLVFNKVVIGDVIGDVISSLVGDLGSPFLFCFLRSL